MSIRIADTEFRYHAYDERGDTLFLSIDGPRYGPPEDTCETPEGHFVELGSNGAILAIELMGVRWHLDREGELRVTLPERRAVASRDELRSALT